jgi:hypothetical protein
MIRNNIRYRLRLAALATLCLTQLNVRGQEWKALGGATAASPDSRQLEVWSYSFPKITVEYGQTLRVNFTYAVEAGRSDQPPAIRVKAQVKDRSGDIFVSRPSNGVLKSLNGGESCFFDVNRDEFLIAGDSRTGALGMVPELVIEVPAGTEVDFPVSLEIINNATGKVILWVRDATPPQMGVAHNRNGNVFTVTFQGSLGSVSHGETLRINLTNTLPLILSDEPVPSADYLLVLRSIQGESEATQRGTNSSGQTLVAEFNRDLMPAAGESETGRLPLAVQITVSVSLTRVQFDALGNTLQFPVSFELVDNATGRTTVMDANRPLRWFSDGPAPL